MALTAPTYAVNNIQELDDLVQNQATALKVLFDKTGADTKTFLIALLAELAATTAASGAKSIGVTTIAGLTGNDVQTLLAALDTAIDAHLADLITDANGAHGLKIEEGAWTPTLAGATVAGTNTYTEQTGTYYKFGNLVFIICMLTLSAKDAAMSGGLRIVGLPFVTALNNQQGISIAQLTALTWPASYKLLVPKFYSSYVRLLGSSGNEEITTLPADIGDTFLIRFSATYRI